MSDHPDNSHYVRRVVLPSGRAIEVVYFENGEPESPQTLHPGSDHPVEDLHVCPACEQRLVYPMDWEEAGAAHWDVVLRCPNCEWESTGRFTQESVDRFDEELDRGTEALVRDLKRLTRANMEDEVERFARALAVDAILPEDF
ncbi:MAG TPA: hypothetical protein VM266_17160 [Solirubrobacteraceae bacterium]|nr:hypothetical protein [Solirubrobacteraceae bacterium]